MSLPHSAPRTLAKAHDFAYRRGNVKHNADLSIEVGRRLHNAWCNVLKYDLNKND